MYYSTYILHFSSILPSFSMHYEQVKESADYLLSRTTYRPKVAIVCGTGLGQ